MKESLWGYWIVVLGISVMSVMMLLQNYTTTSEQDYYLMKSILEASMYDAVDYGYYRDTGNLRMNAEKFTENYYRRFAEVININKAYKLTVYDIYEEPPAVSIAIETSSNVSNFGSPQGSTEDVPVVNRMTGILYTNAKYSPKS